MNRAGPRSIVPFMLRDRSLAEPAKRRPPHSPPWLVSGFPLGPLALILIVLFHALISSATSPTLVAIDTPTPWVSFLTIIVSPRVVLRLQRRRGTATMKVG